jgi:hypothetical protein
VRRKLLDGDYDHSLKYILEKRIQNSDSTLKDVIDAFSYTHNVARVLSPNHGIDISNEVLERMLVSSLLAEDNDTAYTIAIKLMTNSIADIDSKKSYFSNCIVAASRVGAYSEINLWAKPSLVNKFLCHWTDYDTTTSVVVDSFMKSWIKESNTSRLASFLDFVISRYPRESKLPFTETTLLHTMSAIRTYDRRQYDNIVMLMKHRVLNTSAILATTSNSRQADSSTISSLPLLSSVTNSHMRDCLHDFCLLISTLVYEDNIKDINDMILFYFKRIYKLRPMNYYRRVDIFYLMRALNDFNITHKYKIGYNFFISLSQYNILYYSIAIYEYVIQFVILKDNHINKENVIKVINRFENELHTYKLGKDFEYIYDRFYGSLFRALAMSLDDPNDVSNTKHEIVNFALSKLREYLGKCLN